MGKKPRQYNDEFKRQAVYRLIHERISVTQLAREPERVNNFDASAAYAA